ncbi:T3SS effector HopA1 family protein [Streptomyces sp. NPDC015345]|uniref:T3SS effector HopA1 family protein n=1 Tax=Streptomyces sp. NPDC015345 TaxID=3364953 RepID=UPI0036FFDE87
MRRSCDTPEINRLRELATEVLRRHGRPDLSPGHREQGLSTEERGDLVDRLYWAVHAPQERHDGTFSSDRRRFATMVREAEQRLNDLTHEYPGFSWISEDTGTGQTLVACPDGVEVVLDSAQVRRAADGSLATCVASAVAEPVGARWLYWSPPGAAGHTEARVYVHAPIDQAFDMWCGIIRALETAGLRFAAKVGGSDAMLDRPDGIVLYCSTAQLSNVVSHVVPAARGTKDSVPGFSVAVAPGVGVTLAPDKESGGLMAGSVGHHWSKALVDAWAASGEGGLEAVLGQLDESWKRAVEFTRATEEAA